MHSSGESKRLIDQELEILFSELASLQPTSTELEHKLARFLYLFFQNHPLRRGSAAAGIILLNLILGMHLRMAPDAIQRPHSLDLEAMTLTEKEFTERFIKWLNEGVM